MPHAADLLYANQKAGGSPAVPTAAAIAASASGARDAKQSPSPSPAPGGVKLAPPAAGGGKSPAPAAGGAGGGGESGSRTHSSVLTATERSVGTYQLIGEKPIGKGGFGTVWRALNRLNGHTVAVKRMDLRGLNDSEIAEIEQEFRLLEVLKHEHIVSYVANVRHEGFLHIILEFCENGALSSLLAKFGEQPPEQLVAHYIEESLKGLCYLHQQGVVHRDIKGANILTTTDGHVKLTDFGVATKLNESGTFQGAAGTPYWMAPEIVEMAQQTTACDIWSLGCTVIELLTGKPPYYDLNPMAALYRIVAQDMPLPPNISPALQDFLNLCFQKDPARRIDAVGLLKHQWIKITGNHHSDDAATSTVAHGGTAPTVMITPATGTGSTADNKANVSASAKDYTASRPASLSVADTLKVAMRSPVDVRSSLILTAAKDAAARAAANAAAGLSAAGSTNRTGSPLTIKGPATQRKTPGRLPASPQGGSSVAPPTQIPKLEAVTVRANGSMSAAVAAGSPQQRASQEESDRNVTQKLSQPFSIGSSPRSSAGMGVSVARLSGNVSTSSGSSKSGSSAPSSHPSLGSSRSVDSKVDPKSPPVNKPDLSRRVSVLQRTTDIQPADMMDGKHQLSKFQESENDDDGFGDADTNGDTPKRLTGKTTVLFNRPNTGATVAPVIARTDLSDFVEDDDDDDGFDKNTTIKTGRGSQQYGGGSSSANSSANAAATTSDQERLIFQRPNARPDARTGTIKLTRTGSDSSDTSTSPPPQQQLSASGPNTIRAAWGRMDLDGPNSVSSPSSINNNTVLRLDTIAVKVDPTRRDTLLVVNPKDGDVAGAGAGDDDADCFDQIDFQENDDDTAQQETNLLKQFSTLIDELVALPTHDNPEVNEQQKFVELCGEVKDMLRGRHPALRQTMVKSAMLPLLELLEIGSDDIIAATLNVVNFLINENYEQFTTADTVVATMTHEMLDAMCLTGLIPNCIKFSGLPYSLDVRKEAARLVNFFSVQKLKSFIACGGLRCPTFLLTGEYNDATKVLVRTAVDLLTHVFEHSTSTKYELCRVFCKFNLLIPLVAAFQRIHNGGSADAESAPLVTRIANILYVFSRATGDQVIKRSFCKSEVLAPLVSTLPSLHKKELLLVLRTMHSVSLDPNTIEFLEAAGAIRVLVALLSGYRNEFDVQKEVLTALYYLCKVKASRFEEAALAGIIPLLQDLIKRDDPLYFSLKQFALPIIFKVAKASRKSRAKLQEYDGVQFYVDLTSDQYNRMDSLEVLALWCQDDKATVQGVLARADNLQTLLRTFMSVRAPSQFERMMMPFDMLLTYGEKINRGLATLQDGIFVEELKRRLVATVPAHRASTAAVVAATAAAAGVPSLAAKEPVAAHNNNVRNYLLRLLTSLVNALSSDGPAKLAFVTKHGLIQLCDTLIQDASSVLVAAQAKQLLLKCKAPPTLAPAPERRDRGDIKHAAAAAAAVTGRTSSPAVMSTPRAAAAPGPFSNANGATATTATTAAANGTSGSGAKSAASTPTSASLNKSIAGSSGVAKPATTAVTATGAATGTGTNKPATAAATKPAGTSGGSVSAFSKVTPPPTPVAASTTATSTRPATTPAVSSGGIPSLPPLKTTVTIQPGLAAIIDHLAHPSPHGAVGAGKQNDVALVLSGSNTSSLASGSGSGSSVPPSPKSANTTPPDSKDSTPVSTPGTGLRKHATRDRASSHSNVSHVSQLAQRFQSGAVDGASKPSPQPSPPQSARSTAPATAPAAAAAAGGTKDKSKA